MKTLNKLILASALLTASVVSRADWVNGYFRSDGTYVAPYYRTHANGTPYDNLSYRGYPSQQPGYISPRRLDVDPSSLLPKDPTFGSSFGSGLRTMPYLGRRYSSFCY